MSQPTQRRGVTVDEAYADYRSICLQVRVLEDALRLSDEAIAASLSEAECVTVTPTFMEILPTTEFWSLLDGHNWLQGQLQDALAGRQYAYDVWQSILARTSGVTGVDTNVSTHPDMPPALENQHKHLT